MIAGSFSQTYLRNAFNNGLLCIEVPAFVRYLRDRYGAEAAGVRTIIPGDDLRIDFTSGVLTYRAQPFHFPPLGSVPQSLIVAGGVENLVAAQCGGYARVQSPW